MPLHVLFFSYLMIQYQSLAPLTIDRNYWPFQLLSGFEPRTLLVWPQYLRVTVIISFARIALEWAAPPSLQLQYIHTNPKMSREVQAGLVTLTSTGLAVFEFSSVFHLFILGMQTVRPSSNIGIKPQTRQRGHMQWLRLAQVTRSHQTVTVPTCQSRQPWL